MKHSGREHGRPSGQRLPVPPSQCPLQGNGVGRAVDLFREEKRELQDVGSLHLEAPVSLEPRGVELSTGAGFNGSAPCSLPAVGGRGSRTFPRTRLLWLSPLPL